MLSIQKIENKQNSACKMHNNGYRNFVIVSSFLNFFRTKYGSKTCKKIDFHSRNLFMHAFQLVVIKIFKYYKTVILVSQSKSIWNEKQEFWYCSIITWIKYVLVKIILENSFLKLYQFFHETFCIKTISVVDCFQIKPKTALNKNFGNFAK